jgi:hypothetical protein
VQSPFSFSRSSLEGLLIGPYASTPQRRVTSTLIPLQGSSAWILFLF